ncbi:phosphatidylglycerol lysyltransferase domain-containing protein [Adhaeribacter soli]|uniref:Phosphatidylglycerol lysyltransferase n=1 Tax=Adhaeribacter soli TaxID=2607655 RepID=A0A5N1IS95_9BACT|nr:phosphatidylglycerol lysyltransferase domain-containing protein [Adhaeribacter soli]KAA9332791.1 lysylphosphatidylglycerol synthetase family protein [Adhaeribacter soli]
MKKASVSSSFWNTWKEKNLPFLRENGKVILQFIVTLFFISVGIWFLKHEGTELTDVKNSLVKAKWSWLAVMFGITVAYLLLQGLMYVVAFRAVGARVAYPDALKLFLKRNFVSVFLPAGGVSSLAFFGSSIVSKGVKHTQVYFASSIYAFVGLLSVICVAVPAFFFALAEGTVGSGEWYALGTIVLLLIGLVAAYKLLTSEKLLYGWLQKKLPALAVVLSDLHAHKIAMPYFMTAIIISLVIDLAGIVNLYVAMLALGFRATIFVALMGYVVSVILLVVSPFLRGLGAVEFSLTYVLVRLGFGKVEALSITFLYRFFEFWIPLLAGAGTFLLKINSLLLRVVPALLLLALGVVNIISVLTPAISWRLNWLENFLPVQAIHASNYLVLIAGFFLLVTAAFMLKGLRTAWWFALILSLLSFIGHLTKAVDYEEAALALAVVLILVFTRKEYFVRNNPALRTVGLQTALLGIAALLVYGVTGFYFLDPGHFHIDFNFTQALKYTFFNCFLLNTAGLVPADAFARDFLVSLNLSGFLLTAFLLYTLVSPYIIKRNSPAEDFITARELVRRYGNSGMDYFKTYPDKTIFLTDDRQAFLAYRIAGNYAVVLENPVAETSEGRKTCLRAFDEFCRKNSLKCLCYRVPEEELEMYSQLGKKHLFLGQEGVVSVKSFTLQGGKTRSLRNALKKITDLGLKERIYEPPIPEGLLQKLQAVSDEWLQATGRQEISFSQGIFLPQELRQQAVITVENAEEKILAFLNIIPDFAPGEGTFDLVRKTRDAPNGIMDFLHISLLQYFKDRNFETLNLGFAPLSGIESPQSFPERSMKFAYEKIKAFSHYKGLREFKEKFSPEWHNKYLIYSHDYDLLQAPAVLAKVIKP